MNTSSNTAGYDIDNINSYTQFDGGSGINRTLQNYTLQYTVVGDPTLRSLTSVTNLGVNDGTPAVKVNLWDGTSESDVIAGNVNTLVFTFHDTTSGAPESTYTEIDVFGLASIPEPSTYALLGVGLFGLLLFRRCAPKI